MYAWYHRFMVRIPPITGTTWFNSDPLTKEDLLGKVVLVDFWTYTCVNCLNTLPYLKQWWEAYRERNFLIIGIHTPEFVFEKNPENVKQAVKKFKITWPVVLDNDYQNWEAFANRYWPAKYLVDQNGSIVYSHFGEGAYRETETKIRQLLGIEDKRSWVTKSEHTYGNVCFRPTPELYCGYKRGTIANAGGSIPNTVNYYYPPDLLPQDSIALAGQFSVTAEYIRSHVVGATIYLNFHATQVNTVVKPVNGMVTVELRINGNRLPMDIIGEDVNEFSLAYISKPRMYNLIKSQYGIQGILGIIATEQHFQVYAFTFSGCEH